MEKIFVQIVESGFFLSFYCPKELGNATQKYLTILMLFLSGLLLWITIRLHMIQTSCHNQTL